MYPCQEITFFNHDAMLNKNKEDCKLFSFFSDTGNTKDE
ncbi:MAG: hypothetical protein JETT_3707 [Candidatus Jettenia ecosi]|uniref:Uncharacterized protein n=1 Tax=Candidatus Jettenia ecosi TaxID=2494326 RepID=A0A533Q634_9BACT|nr:MAG: hypothetical protein JETT_3707 [Candidatus Jettenia ecosi]